MSKEFPTEIIFKNADIINKMVYLLSVSSQAAEYSANILKRSCKVYNFFYNLIKLKKVYYPVSVDC